MIENMENFLEWIMTEEGIQEEKKNSDTIHKISSIM